MAGLRGAWAAVALAGALLAGCSSTNSSKVRIIDGAPVSKAAPIRVMSAAEIRSTLSGRTWQYTRGDLTGIITYNADGTSAYQDDTKGSGTGNWSVNGDQLCETFDKVPAQQCGQFKSTGDAYFAGKVRFVEMKL